MMHFCKFASKTLFFLTALAVIATSGNAAIFKADPGYPDTLKIDSVRALVSAGNVRVPVNFFNDEQLGAVEVTIRNTSSFLVLDSASFSGSRLSYLNYKGSRVYGNVIVMYALVTSESMIGAGGGLLATVYLHTVGTVTPQIIPLDTATIIDTNYIEHSTSFSDAALEQIRPIVKNGFINFQNTCCVGTRGNVDGSADGVIDIADVVYLVDYLMGTPGAQPPPCPEAANIDASPDGIVDIADLATFVDYLFLGQGTLPPCPAAAEQTTFKLIQKK